MKLTFIGMSGSGKTFWSKKLEKIGFKRICCDDLIEEKIGYELKPLGYLSVRDAAKWLGQPFDPQYPKTSSKYLNFEREVMLKILQDLKQNTDENIIIDTSGSVIYTEKDILNKLAKLTKVIYLDTPPSAQKIMYQLYLNDPKPVIWGDSFSKIEGETDYEALARCYSKLLAFRTKKYQKLADVTLDYQQMHDPNFTTDNFLEFAK